MKTNQVILACQQFSEKKSGHGGAAKRQTPAKHCDVRTCAYATDFAIALKAFYLKACSASTMHAEVASGISGDACAHAGTRRIAFSAPEKILFRNTAEGMKTGKMRKIFRSRKENPAAMRGVSAACDATLRIRDSARWPARNARCRHRSWSRWRIPADGFQLPGNRRPD